MEGYFLCFSLLFVFLYLTFPLFTHIFVQVSLLNQEVIVEKIQSVVESVLRNSNESRTFQEQVNVVLFVMWCRIYCFPHHGDLRLYTCL